VEPELTRAARGHLRSSYSTWPAEFQQGAAEAGRFRASLVDEVGEWWHCGHRHLTSGEAVRCAREQNRAANLVH
jgi:hypothetical protein